MEISLSIANFFPTTELNNWRSFNQKQIESLVSQYNGKITNISLSSANPQSLPKNCANCKYYEGQDEALPCTVSPLKCKKDCSSCESWEVSEYLNPHLGLIKLNQMEINCQIPDKRADNFIKNAANTINLLISIKNPIGYHLHKQVEKALYKIIPLKAGYRFEFWTTDENHFWNYGVYSSVEEANTVAHQIIISEHEDGCADNSYLIDNALTNNDEFYRNWLICGYSEDLELGTMMAIDPETNQIHYLDPPEHFLFWQKLDWAKDYIDEIERDRIISPGQLSLLS